MPTQSTNKNPIRIYRKAFTNPITGKQEILELNRPITNADILAARKRIQDNYVSAGIGATIGKTIGSETAESKIDRLRQAAKRIEDEIRSGASSSQKSIVQLRKDLSNIYLEIQRLNGTPSVPTSGLTNNSLFPVSASPPAITPELKHADIELLEKLQKQATALLSLLEQSRKGMDFQGIAKYQTSLRTLNERINIVRERISERARKADREKMYDLIQAGNPRVSNEGVYNTTGDISFTPGMDPFSNARERSRNVANSFSDPIRNVYRTVGSLASQITPGIALSLSPDDRRAYQEMLGTGITNAAINVIPGAESLSMLSGARGMEYLGKLGAEIGGRVILPAAMGVSSEDPYFAAITPTLFKPLEMVFRASTRGLSKEAVESAWSKFEQSLEGLELTDFQKQQFRSEGRRMVLGAALRPDLGQIPPLSQDTQNFFTFPSRHDLGEPGDNPLPKRQASSQFTYKDGSKVEEIGYTYSPDVLGKSGMLQTLREVRQKFFDDPVDFKTTYKYLHNLNPALLKDVAIRFSDELRVNGSQMKGLYSYVNNIDANGVDKLYSNIGHGVDIIRIAKHKEGKLYAETIFHEIAHNLERFLSDEEDRAIQEAFKKAYKANANRRNDHMFDNYHEWWAYTIQDYEYSRRLIDYAVKNQDNKLLRAIAKAKLYALNFVDDVKINIGMGGERGVVVSKYKQILKDAEKRSVTRREYGVSLEGRL